ncbi:hypothetical protein KP509_09G031400 [Ceratopteris richardii]|uniref:cysteine synthase n=1 Tax=Ceratopteris richardii TaxID=49495 RepID=A0A8T2U5C5_CERRI|nr:hypothetical protein KP509_09G031400 [Ceratopteris richardii]
MASSKIAALCAAALVCVAVTVVYTCSWRHRLGRKNLGSTRSSRRRTGVLEAIGNTPLIKIHSLSEATGCQILGKAEFLNPGGSVKDRVALQIIEEAQTLEALGATVDRVRPVSISHKDHFVNIARRKAELAESAYRAQLDGKNESEKDCRGGYFADQFENLANFRAHYQHTGPEIWAQTSGDLDAFIAAAGTGGTVAGISRFLKEKDKRIQCFLIDPPGSSLYNRVTRGVMYAHEEAEGKRLKNPFDTITEGIGINRLTENFKLALLDGAFRGTDREAVEMARFLVKKEGLFLGSSSAMNCVGAYRVAKQLGPGHTIVTILCDSGIRHLSKFYNVDYLARLNLTPTAEGLEFLGTKEPI